MIYFLLALTPILLIVFLLLFLKKPLTIAAPITFFYTLLISIFIWKQNYDYIFGSLTKGTLVAIDISIIIFGAILFLEFLKQTKILDSIEKHLNKISPDKRIQTILLVWFFGSFIEGTAGFGTPIAIIAPLLVGIGFPAIKAVVLALIGNSTAVAFGAVGTPIRIGLTGLDISNVVFYTAGINLIAGIIVPMLLLFVLVKPMKKSNKDIIEAIPFAIWAGLCFTIPYFLASFLGQEFPSLLGPLIGLAIIILTIKKGFLVPKNIWTFKSSKKKYAKMSLTHSFLPYLILILLLIIGKFVLPSFPFTIINGIDHSINFFNPGLIFILTVIISMLFYKFFSHDFSKISKYSFKVLVKPFIAILFIVSFVQIMIHSGVNSSGLPSIISILAQSISNPFLPIISPFVGIFGAFITGSATVSTILFGGFQASSAISLGYNVGIILALHSIV
jgi:lactate permease